MSGNDNYIPGGEEARDLSSFEAWLADLGNELIQSGRLTLNEARQVCPVPPDYLKSPLAEPLDEFARKRVAKPRMGDRVHYVLPDGPRAGEHRHAVITSTWDFSPCNLMVYRDQDDDTPAGAAVEAMPVLRVWSARLDNERNTPGTFHWPEAS
jgi:hypothetical protein